MKPILVRIVHDRLGSRRTGWPARTSRTARNLLASHHSLFTMQHSSPALGSDMPFGHVSGQSKALSTDVPRTDSDQARYPGTGRGCMVACSIACYARAPDHLRCSHARVAPRRAPPPALWFCPLARAELSTHWTCCTRYQESLPLSVVRSHRSIYLPAFSAPSRCCPCLPCLPVAAPTDHHVQVQHPTQHHHPQRSPPTCHRSVDPPITICLATTNIAIRPLAPALSKVHVFHHHHTTFILLAQANTTNGVRGTIQPR